MDGKVLGRLFIVIFFLHRVLRLFKVLRLIHIKMNSIIVPFRYLSTSPIEFIPIIKGKGSIVYIVHNDNIQTIRELGILEVVD